MIGQEDIDDIVALAKAELDHWPAPKVSAVQVLSVLATVYPDAFEKWFGDTGLSDLEEMLTRGTTGGSPRDIRALLAAADSVEDAMRRLHALVGLQPIGMDEGAARGHEEWLVAHINERFTLYELAPTSHTLDKLYVLIGALKVVNLEPAYATMRERLAIAIGASIGSNHLPKTGDAGR